MDWTSDFRYALRGLLRTPGFLVTSVVTLALAIGAVVGMFNVVYTVVLRPLPFPDSDRLVVLSGTAPGSDLPDRFGLSREFYVHYKERSQLLDGVFLFGAGTSTLRRRIVSNGLRWRFRRTTSMPRSARGHRPGACPSR